MSSVENDYVLVIEVGLMYGFAGIKCVQFALQVMGMNVCGITPENYSVHYFYEKSSKVALTVEDLDTTYCTLKANGIHKKFTHVLTGLITTNEMLSKCVEIVKDLKTCNPDIIYKTCCTEHHTSTHKSTVLVCDPVLGDNGDFFDLPVDMRATYRDVLIPLADITTPNQFELESISGMKIHTQYDALKAVERVHDKGPDVVIMTSSTLENNNDIFTTIGSRRKEDHHEVYRIDYPRLDANLIGTGDLFAGSFVGLIRKTDNMKESLEKAISIMQIVCQRTYRHGKEQAGPGNPITHDLIQLRVVQCASFIMNPQVIYPSTKLL